MKDRYQVMFEIIRLLKVAIHKEMLMYLSLENNNNIDSLRFRLSPAQGLIEEHSSGVPRPVHGFPPIELPHKTLIEQHFMEHIPATLKKVKPYKLCGMHKTWGKKISRATTQTSNSNPVVSIAHI
jgi:hypothetical protein